MATEPVPLDLALVQAARGGDSAAAGELIRRHAPGVLTLLTRLLRGDREAALDLAQETFLRAYRNLERFDDSRSFRAWINAIAMNLGLDQLRKRRRRGERVGLSFEDSGEERWGPGSLAREPQDHREEPPQEFFERQEERDLVRRAIDLLPAQHRAVLVLRDLEGLSYEDVARVLACRLGTAKSKINRARLEFRDVYLRLEASFKERRQ
jgi:RNA polymerase sigma-70 factor (ECF subfamily)